MKNLCKLLLFIMALIVLSNHAKPQTQNDIYYFYYKEHNTADTTYGPSTEFLTEHISSDYGKRYLSNSGTRWHRGVDFAIKGTPVNQWDHFTSLNTGTIKKIEGRAGYKYIITEGTQPNRLHHFGYGHLFEHAVPNPSYRRGGLVLIRMDSPHTDKFAIIDLTSDEERALGQVTGTATFNLNGTDSVWDVSNQITQGEVLGNIGRSKGMGNYGYMHVHVYLFDNIEIALGNQGQGLYDNIHNDHDPLLLISHVNTDYFVDMMVDGAAIDNQNIITSSGANSTSNPMKGRMPRCFCNPMFLTTILQRYKLVQPVIRSGQKKTGGLHLPQNKTLCSQTAR